MLSGLLLGTGTLGDRIGHRLMFLTGVTIFGVGSLIAAFSPSAWFLIAARGLLGVGAATMMPASLALVRITFTNVRERNLAIAIWIGKGGRRSRRPFANRRRPKCPPSLDNLAGAASPYAVASPPHLLLVGRP